jgi:hypothetical protein
MTEGDSKSGWGGVVSRGIIRYRRPGGAVAIAILLAATGCAGNGTLAWREPDGAWRSDWPARVYAGAPTEHRFAVQLGECDYVHLLVGDDVWLDAAKDLAGGFTARYAFQRPENQTGEVRLGARGYVIRDRRDAMPIDGALDPHYLDDDRSDRLVASVDATVRVEQRVVETRLALADPEWRYVVLRIECAGQPRIEHRRATRESPGFVAERDTDGSGWRIRYALSHEEAGFAEPPVIRLIYFDEQGAMREQALSARQE